MQALVVVAIDELIELLLLLQEVLTRRLGVSLLRCRVHAPMPAVLLQFAWLDALDADPRAQPPHLEPA